MNAPFYHVGIIVENLDAAIARFSKVFEVTFNPPTTFTVQVDGDDGPPTRDVVATYCRQGPPYIELIQGHETGFLSLANGEGFHHLGVWSPAGATQSELDRFHQLHVEAMVGAGGAPAMISSPTTLNGVRLELVNEAGRAGVEAWIRGEAWT